MKFEYFILFFGILTSQSMSGECSRDDRGLRVFGGSETVIQASPYLVSMRCCYEAGCIHNCGGAILRADTILTAKHCMYFNTCLDKKIAGKIRVVAGFTKLSDEGPMHDIECYDTYPGDMEKFDLAVVKLSRPIGRETPNWKTIDLTEKEPVIGSVCEVFGWGGMFLSNGGPPHPPVDHLRTTNLTVIESPECCTEWSVFCTKGFSSADSPNGSTPCPGDSGGPLICSGRLAGVVSHSCTVNLTAVFARVTAFREWILKPRQLGDPEKLTCRHVDLGSRATGSGQILQTSLLLLACQISYLLYRLRRSF